MDHLSRHEPSRNEPCLCGSGIKFKRCCMSGYQDGAHRRSNDYFNQGRYAEALQACRRHLTWYILCHRAHTVPFHRAQPRQAAELLSIDIGALASLVDLLFRCYLQLGMSGDFPKVIEAIESVVADSRWNDKIHYFRALWMLIVRDDTDNAFQEISLVDIPKCRDSEILGLYWSTYPNNLDFQTSMDLLDRIIECAETSSERLYFAISKGVRFCMICEVDRGCEIIGSAIQEYRAADARWKSNWGKLQLARGLEIVAELKDDVRALDEAAREYGELVTAARNAAFSDVHQSELATSLGVCLSLRGDHRGAAVYFEQSLSLKKSELTQVFYARAQIRAGSHAAARARLATINTATFDSANMADYAFAWAELAATSLEKQDLVTAIASLKAAPSDHPLFEQYRQKWLVALLETTPKMASSQFAYLLRKMNQYVSLKPNVFGIGLDLNKIIEDIDTGPRNDNTTTDVLPPREVEDRGD